MVWPLIVGAISLVSQLGAAKKQEEVGEYNANALRMQAKDARLRGEFDVRRIRLEARALMGAQRAGFAGQNVDVESGVALDVASDTAYITELDAIQAMNNAFKEAWSNTTQADIVKLEAQSGANASRAQGIGSLIQGVGSFIGAGGS